MSYTPKGGHGYGNNKHRSAKSFQASRSKRSQSMDARLKAPIAKSIEEWMANPNRLDLLDVDMPKGGPVVSEAKMAEMHKQAEEFRNEQEVAIKDLNSHIITGNEAKEAQSERDFAFRVWMEQRNFRYAMTNKRLTDADRLFMALTFDEYLESESGQKVQPKGSFRSIYDVRIFVREGESLQSAFERQTGKNFENAGMQLNRDVSEKQIIDEKKRIKKAIYDAYREGGTVPFSLGTLMEAGVSVDVARKVYRQGSG